MSEKQALSDDLFDAIRENDDQEVERLLQAGADPNDRYLHQMTLFWGAASQAIKTNNFNITTLLLQYKADPNLALYQAVAWDENTEVMELLLERWADVDYQRLDGETFLFRAVVQKNLEKVRLLLKYNANPNLEENFYGTPLHYAAYFGNREQIIDELLLSNKVDRNAQRTSDGTTPLYQAVRGFELDNARKLLNEDSDLEVMDNERVTFLHMVVQYKKEDYFDLLWSDGNCPIDVDAKTTHGETPLFFAAENGPESFPCARWLLDRGALADIADNSQDTPFLRCAQTDNVEMGKLLAQKSKPDILYAVDSDGRGALHHAVRNRRTEFLDWLLDENGEFGESRPERRNGLDPNRPDNQQITPVHLALYLSESSTAKRLLKVCKPDIVNEIDEIGNTPLHASVSRNPGDVEFQRAMMAKMSSSALTRSNNEGESILSLAVDNAIKYQETTLLFDLLSRPLDVEYSGSDAWPSIICSDRAHVAYIAERFNQGFLPSAVMPDIVFWAARNGARDLVTRLLSLIVSSDYGWTATVSKSLYWAAAGNQNDIVIEVMRQYKDDIRDQDDTIQAVRVAALRGYEAIVRSLLCDIRTDEQVPRIEACTGLYWAVTWQNEHAKEIVRHLLMHGVSPFSPADDGQTVLEWATHYHREAENDQVMKEYDMLGLLESPIRVPHRPKAPQKPTEHLEGVKKHFCTISDFYRQGKDFYTLQRRSNCYDVIYSDGPDKKMKESWSSWSSKPRKKPDFRWIHRPLNDWKLAEDLMDMIYYESPRSDLEYTHWMSFVRGTRKEHAGPAQSRFMYPMLHFQTKDHGSGESSTLIQFLDNEEKLASRATDKAKKEVQGKGKEKTLDVKVEAVKGSAPKGNPKSNVERIGPSITITEGEGGMIIDKTNSSILQRPSREAGHDPRASNSPASVGAPIAAEKTPGAERPGISETGWENQQGDSKDTGAHNPSIEAVPSSSLDESLYISKTQSETRSPRNQDEQQVNQQNPNTFNPHINQRSEDQERSGQKEQHSSHFQVQVDAPPSDTASAFDRRSTSSQKPTSSLQPKRSGSRIRQERNILPSGVQPPIVSDRAVQDTGEQGQLEKCKIALAMPFLTFQTVREQRKTRQDIIQAEGSGSANSSTGPEPKNRTRNINKTLAKEVSARLEKETCSSLTKGIVYKAIRRVSGDTDAFGYDMDSQKINKLLHDYIDSTDMEEQSSALISSLNKSLARSLKKASTTDIIEAIEYFIDALCLDRKNGTTKGNGSGNGQRTSNDRLHTAQPHDSSNTPLVPADSGEEGQEESIVRIPRERHLSRTLDQYFYSSLPDTVRRDADQVIRRYQARKHGTHKSPPGVKGQNVETNQSPLGGDQDVANSSNLDLEFQADFKICMVDQLWLWVLDEKTIITCFPHAERDPKRPKDYQESPLDRIHHHINQEMRPQIQNAYHLAALITSFCVSSIDECRAQIGEGSETLFDMFAGSIGFVANEEVNLFSSFRNEQEADDSDLALDRDIELLEEIKDIRDELNILERILDDQNDLTQKLFSLIGDTNIEGRSTPIFEDQVLQYYHQRAGVGLRLDRIRKMDEDAKISNDAVNYLLDLKQKHANVMEAKAARKQAEETADQGRTILVFTIVTIVFAPLSFLSSFFALSIESFPHSPDGDVSFPNSWIYWRVYGISVAIFVPLIACTLAYRQLKDLWVSLVRKLRGPPRVHARDLPVGSETVHGQSSGRSSRQCPFPCCKKPKRRRPDVELGH